MIHRQRFSNSFDANQVQFSGTELREMAYDNLKTVAEVDRELQNIPDFTEADLEILKNGEEFLISLQTLHTEEIEKLNNDAPGRASKAAKENLATRLATTKQKYESRERQYHRENPAYRQLLLRDLTREALYKRKTQLLADTSNPPRPTNFGGAGEPLGLDNGGQAGAASGIETAARLGFSPGLDGSDDDEDGDIEDVAMAGRLQQLADVARMETEVGALDRQPPRPLNTQRPILIRRPAPLETSLAPRGPVLKIARTTAAQG